jgi:DNA-binding CsgD family transcriptional regulator
MIESLFFDLVGKIDGIKTRDDGNRALRETAQNYGLTHATYLGVNIPSLTEKSLYYISTYSDGWCDHYVKSDYVKIDPVIKSGLSGILPFDWSSLSHETLLLNRFFGEAREFGVGLNGLSFPIRGAHGETALFSINSDSQGKDWEDLKRNCVRDFQIFAYHLHTQMLASEGVKFEDTSLSPREVECLKWAAAGKTTWETGAVIGISETTVKFFLENARTKLGAVNKTQAVAKAISARLI